MTETPTPSSLVHAEYQFTMMEWREAFQNARSSKSRYGLIVWLIYVALIVAIPAVIHHHVPGLDVYFQSKPTSLIYWAVVVGIPLLFISWKRPRIMGHRRLPMRADLDERHVEISIGSGPIRGPRRGLKFWEPPEMEFSTVVWSKRWPWEQFAALSETDRLFLLRLKDGEGAVPIPKRVLSDGQMAQIRAFATVLR